MDSDDSNKYRIFKIKPKKLKGEDEARRILEKLAEDVQPIMQKHRWRVKKLKEFLKPKLNGLNYMHGVKIRIRLRQFQPMHHKFRPYNDILNTMLHELCHNDFSGHKSDFQNLLNLVKQEYNQGTTNDSVDGCDAVLSNTGGNQESSSNNSYGAYAMPWDDTSNIWNGGYNMIPSNNFWDDSSNTQRNAPCNNFWDDTSNTWSTGYDRVPSNNFWDDTGNTWSTGYDSVPSNNWDDIGNTRSTGYARVPNNNFWDDTSNTWSTGYARVPSNNFWDNTSNTWNTGYDRVPSNNFWDDTSNTWSRSAGYDTVPSNNFWDDSNNESDSYHNSDVCTIQ